MANNIKWKDKKEIILEFDVTCNNEYDKEFKRRFLEKVSKIVPQNPKTCIEWIGSYRKIKGKDAYGYLSFRNEKIYSHRVSWLIHHGKLSNLEVICHSCDNPKCVRIEHLFSGTQSDNLKDCRDKGRAFYPTDATRVLVPKGDKLFSRNHPERMFRGEQLPQHKLTVEDVLKIKELRKTGLTQEQIASMFAVKRAAISAILIGRTWKHVK